MENKSPKDLIIEELNKIEKPDPNIAIDYVRENFMQFLDAYCDGVSMMVNRYWRHVELCVNTQDDFVKNTQNDTQKHLYDYYIGEIKPTLQYKLLELTSDYVKEIRKAVPEFTKTYSIEAKEAVIRVIDHESVMLHFEEVEIEEFKGIPFHYFEGGIRPISLYVRSYIRALKGNDKRMGVFERQCIYEPAMQYYDQIENWADNLYNRIEEILLRDLRTRTDKRNPEGCK